MDDEYASGPSSIYIVEGDGMFNQSAFIASNVP